jgi:hypothetical protein
VASVSSRLDAREIIGNAGPAPCRSLARERSVSATTESRKQTEQAHARREGSRSSCSIHDDRNHLAGHVHPKTCCVAIETQLSLGSNADFKRHDLRRIESGVVRLVFSTNTATSGFAERLKYGVVAMASSPIATRHGALDFATPVAIRIGFVGASSLCSACDRCDACACAPVRLCATRAYVTHVVASAVCDARHSRPSSELSSVSAATMRAFDPIAMNENAVIEGR